jgi:hypothetical protein
MKKRKETLRFAVPLGLLLLASCHVIREPADMQTLRESRPVGAVKELVVDLEFDVGKLEIVKTSGELFAFDLDYDRNRYDARFNFDEGERASMSLDVDSRGGVGPGGGDDNELRLQLTDSVPLDLNLSAGVSESTLDMTGIRVRSLRLRGGVGKTDLTFDKPSGQPLNSLDVESGVGELIIHGLGNAQVERLDLSGGVGHTELDFTGDLGATHTDAKIKVGVGGVKLRIPRDADVEIEAEGSFLSHIKAPSFERNGNSYIHRGGGAAKLRIRVESGVGGVEVDLI